MHVESNTALKLSAAVVSAILFNNGCQRLFPKWNDVELHGILSATIDVFSSNENALKSLAVEVAPEANIFITLPKPRV